MRARAQYRNEHYGLMEPVSTKRPTADRGPLESGSEVKPGWRSRYSGLGFSPGLVLVAGFGAVLAGGGVAALGAAAGACSGSGAFSALGVGGATGVTGVDVGVLAPDGSGVPAGGRPAGLVGGIGAVTFAGTPAGLVEAGGGALATDAVLVVATLAADTVSGGAWAVANSVTGLGGGGLKPGGAA